ncbi:MAG: pantoate--beta-alanine ligase [Candidatus Dormibacteria bacterium]
MVAIRTRSTAITEPAQPRPIDTPARLRDWSDRCRSAGLVVGLVPTMGALHAGHRSLIRRARLECDRVAVSIFVNPRQFGPGEDLDRYPRTLQADMAVLAAEGADVAFIPSVEAMYPPGHAISVSVGPPLGTTLEAAARPGHVDGVALVVTKLLSAARPDRAYFGEKDAQQCAVVRHLVRELDLGAEIVVCPTVRDADGLALSSRNAYLSPEERGQAVAIHESLLQVATEFARGVREPALLVAAARHQLSGARGVRAEYVALVDADTFVEAGAPAARGEQLSSGQTRWLCLVAARVGGTRLIDAVSLQGAAEEADSCEGPDVCDTVVMSSAGVSGGGGRQCSASF